MAAGPHRFARRPPGAVPTRGPQTVVWARHRLRELRVRLRAESERERNPQVRGLLEATAQLLVALEETFADMQARGVRR